MTPHGIWLLAEGVELLVPFEDYPALRGGTIEQLCRVELHHSVHLRWADLDVDVEIEALVHPERYPLAYRS